MLDGLCKKRSPKQAAVNFQAENFKGKSRKRNFSFIVINLVNKGILHFLITNGLFTDCSTKEFVHKFFRQNTLKKSRKC